MKHLTTVEQLNLEDVNSIFEIADRIQAEPSSYVLKDKVIALLFFENSTRTLVSFELAAKKLGAHVINVNISKSSTQKGESLKDTIQTLQAMGIDAFIVRHSDNYICEKIKQWLKPNVQLINAGDGNNQHPTQALLDAYTIRQNFSSFENLKISIIGDVKHSRVANSFLGISKILKIHSTSIYGPKELMINGSHSVFLSQSMNNAISNKDVIMLLRIQKERIESIDSIDFSQYNQQFGFKSEHLKLLNTDSIIMHPGPFNRGVEIDSEVADNPPSVILNQVRNGVLIRQAVLIRLLDR